MLFLMFMQGTVGPVQKAGHRVDYSPDYIGLQTAADRKHRLPALVSLPSTSAMTAMLCSSSIVNK